MFREEDDHHDLMAARHIIKLGKLVESLISCLISYLFI